MVVSATGEGGIGLATTQAAADMVGLNLTTATYTTSQGTGTDSAERLVDVIINPDAVMRFRMSGGSSEGTALPLQTVTVASAGGTAIETGAAWNSPTVLDGVAWGHDGANVSQIRGVTTVSSTVGTVVVPFDNAIVVGDNFLRAGIFPLSVDGGVEMELTAAFYEYDATAASTGGAPFVCIDFDLRDGSEDGRNQSFVEVIAGDHFFSRLS